VGKCLNCHDPHGAKDAQGPIPSMLRVREPTLCAACHDGRRARKDVAGELRKFSVHPLLGAAGSAARPLAPGRIAPACSTCHEPHRARSDPSAQSLGQSPRLDGALRPAVSFGARGAPPVLRDERRDDAIPPAEFEVCFRCHAGPRSAATGAASIAVLLNPANASYHPVVERTRSVSAARSFAAGWSPGRTITCSDCHGGDDDVRGPHGSTYAPILRRRLAASGEPAREGDLCFACHAWATYGDPSGGLAGTFSRFTDHGPHAARGVSCGACHDAHGSLSWPALLVSRPQGITALTLGATGATCTATCHVATPFTVTYRAAVSR
jgi:predicted CXXCH cytochrome family protein